MKTLIQNFLLLAGVLVAGFTPALADTITDDFSTGPNPAYWKLGTNAPRFSVSATNGAFRISSVSGGATGFTGDGLWSLATAYGNFDLSLDFTNANLTWLTGGPGNQAQINCLFGDFNSTTNFLLVRSDEPETGGDQNAHVWIGGFVNQGGHRLGAAYPTTVSFGTLRVNRTNSLVSAYLNSTLIAQTNNYSTAPMKFLAVLQNNGTSDAISITYDNFKLTADKITVGPALNIQMLANNRVAISWPTWGAVWATNYLLETAVNLSGVWQAVTNIPGTNGSNFAVTNAVGGSSGFYRLRYP